MQVFFHFNFRILLMNWLWRILAFLKAQLILRLRRIYMPVAQFVTTKDTRTRVHSLGKNISYFHFSFPFFISISSCLFLPSNTDVVVFVGHVGIFSVILVWMISGSYIVLSQIMLLLSSHFASWQNVVYFLYPGAVVIDATLFDFVMVHVLLNFRCFQSNVIVFPVVISPVLSIG